MKDSVAEKQLNVILHTNFLRLFKNAHTNDTDAYWDVYQTIVITVMFEKKKTQNVSGKMNLHKETKLPTFNFSILGKWFWGTVSKWNIHHWVKRYHETKQSKTRHRVRLNAIAFSLSSNYHLEADSHSYELSSSRYRKCLISRGRYSKHVGTQFESIKLPCSW